MQCKNCALHWMKDARGLFYQTSARMLETGSTTSNLAEMMEEELVRVLRSNAKHRPHEDDFVL